MSLTLKQKIISLQYQSEFSFKGILETFYDIGEDYDSGKINNSDFEELFSNIFLRKQVEVLLNEFQRVGVKKYGMFDSKIVISNEKILVDKLITEFLKDDLSLKLMKDEIYKNIPNEWKQHLEYVSYEVKETLSADILSMLKLLSKHKACNIG
jgi:hypothetical protein